MNHDGKYELIENEVIKHAWRYLRSDSYEMRLNASLVLMSATIHLVGKHQALQADANGNLACIEAIEEKLMNKGDPDLRKNLKVALINIAELPEGFHKVIH